jgi:hypothetical protein
VRLSHGSCLLFLGLIVGCSGARPRVPTAPVDSAPQGAWSRAVALDVLAMAIASEEPQIRALGFEAWIGSGDPGAVAIMARAAMDPSPHVQQVLAATVPAAVATGLQGRRMPDPLAWAWLGLSGVPIGQLEGVGPAVWLANAIAGDEAAKDALNSAIEEGEVPADEGFFTLLAQAPLDGLGSALWVGTPVAEPEVRLSMALALMARGHSKAPALLAAVLAETEDAVAPFLAVEAVVRNRTSQSEAWLRQASGSASPALATHATLGLVALGAAPVAKALAAMQSDDRDTRAWAVECFAQASVERPLPRDHLSVLQGSARDESPTVKAAAVAAIVRLTDVADVPTVQPFRGDQPDPVTIFLAGKWLAAGIEASAR